MTNFNPPIETRTTDELVIISKSNTDEWQQIAIDLAKNELTNRGMNQTQIDLRYAELEKEYERQIETELKMASEEDYSLFEKVLIVLFWPKELFHGWFLRSNGYKLKAKRRLQLIGIGVIMYLIIMLTSV